VLIRYLKRHTEKKKGIKIGLKFCNCAEANANLKRDTTIQNRMFNAH